MLWRCARARGGRRRTSLRSRQRSAPARAPHRVTEEDHLLVVPIAPHRLRRVVDRSHGRGALASCDRERTTVRCRDACRADGTAGGRHGLAAAVVEDGELDRQLAYCVDSGRSAAAPSSCHGSITPGESHFGGRHLTRGPLNGYGRCRSASVRPSRGRDTLFMTLLGPVRHDVVPPDRPTGSVHRSPIANPQRRGGRALDRILRELTGASGAARAEMSFRQC